MIWIYIATAIFGGAFLIPMVLGGLDSEVGDGLDADGMGTDVDLADGLEADVDGAVDSPDLDTGSELGNALGAVFASLVSFRTVVFFSAFFGTSGLVFDILGYSTVATLATAILIGAIAAVANSLLFGLIRASQPNSQISDRTLEGRPARVVLPMDGGQRGRVRVDLSGQPQYIVARPMVGQEQQFDVGDSVVVVKIENGTALVASLSELELGEE